MDNLDKLGETYNAASPMPRTSAWDLVKRVSFLLYKGSIITFCFIWVALKQVMGIFWCKHKSIKDQVVLVTGGANGLGRALSLRFAAEGAHIAVADLDLTNAELLAKEIQKKYRVKSFPYKLDVANYTSVDACRLQIEKDLGPVDILVNNAGILPLASLREGKPSDLEKIISVNLTAHLWTNRIFLETMIQRKRGHIVAVSSVAGLSPALRAITYSATKCGVRGLMIALQDELEADGLDKYIHTTTIYPWFINTRKEMQDRVYDKIPVFQTIGILTPKYVADCAVKAVLSEKETCVVPNFSKYLFYLQSALPREYRKVIRKVLVSDVPKMMD